MLFLRIFTEKIQESIRYKVLLFLFAISTLKGLTQRDSPLGCIFLPTRQRKREREIEKHSPSTLIDLWSAHKNKSLYIYVGKNVQKRLDRLTLRLCASNAHNNVNDDGMHDP